MIAEIHHFSLAGFRAFRDLASAQQLAVISILDKGEALQHGRPELGCHFRSLALSFEDSFEACGDAPWPDEPSSLEHLRLSQEYGERVPTLSDARRIVEFIYELQSQPQAIALAVHCHAGISRSVAVAQWAAARLSVPVAPAPAGVPTPEFVPRPNPRVLRLLDKAWACRDPITAA